MNPTTPRTRAYLNRARRSTFPKARRLFALIQTVLTAMIKLFLIVNRHGETRLAQYYGQRPSLEERQKLENEIIRQCVARNEEMSFCVHHGDLKLVYKRYLAIYCIAGIEEDANEISILSLFDFLFQTLREYFGDITEFHILYRLAETYTALNEIIMDGQIVETSKTKVLASLNSIFV
jgi:AP-4 complex subunit sigma-1